MQINSDDTINSHSFDQTGDICGRNRNTSLHLSVLSCISIVRNDNGDSSGTGSSQCRNHEQQLHDVVVDGRAGWLDDVAVLSSNILVNNHVGLAISETTDCCLSEVDVEVTANFQRERQVSVSRKEFDSTRVLLCLFRRLFDFPFLCGHIGDRFGNGSNNGGLLFRQSGCFAFLGGTRRLHSLLLGFFLFFNLGLDGHFGIHRHGIDHTVLCTRKSSLDSGRWRGRFLLFRGRVGLWIKNIGLFGNGGSTIAGCNSSGSQEGGTGKSQSGGPRSFVIALLLPFRRRGCGGRCGKLANSKVSGTNRCRPCRRHDDHPPRSGQCGIHIF
mmetsp:Transcript_649/g.1352  ORF Transcript_649/g.1352 Transcript_649/m.1352 type:complete len:327 (+) Transcript_649:701-1681(+)